MLRAQEASKYEARKPRRQEEKSQECREPRNCVIVLCFFLSFFPSLLLSFSCPSFLVFMYFLCSLCCSFFIPSCFLSFFLSFFLSLFLSSSGLGLEHFVFFLIPAREARKTVFYYKIQDFVCFLILICFLLILICFCLMLICFFFDPLPKMLA